MALDLAEQVKILFLWALYYLSIVFVGVFLLVYLFVFTFRYEFKYELI